LTSGPQDSNGISSPDQNAAGLIQCSVDALRYDVQVFDPDEVSGIVASFIPTGSRVLDVGCGTGLLGQILSERCHAEIIGIEPDPARAELATARGLQAHVGYFSRESIQELGAFDVVLFADVLEHLPNPQGALLLAREALKNGGAVIISVPNVVHWSVRVEVIRGKFRYQPCGIMDATHLRWFTAESAKSLLLSAGFKVVKYRATAGSDVPDNICRLPLRWIPANARTHFLRVASRRWPNMFGAQHILKADMT
jgi:methionine biosynthesis protein MetW